jgi:hypothetical protein
LEAPSVDELATMDAQLTEKSKQVQELRQQVKDKSAGT